MSDEERTRIIELQPSNMENIDTAFFEYLDETLNIFCTTNKGRTKVPVIWAGAERSYQIKHNKNIRDKNGILILPLLTVERTSVVKDLQRKGPVVGNIKPPNLDDPRGYRGGSIKYARRIQQDKTANFLNADAFRKRRPGMIGADNNPNFQVRKRGEKIVYETVTVPQPVYIDITYAVTLRAEYQQQINEMVAPFVTKTGAVNQFVMRRNSHLYEGFIQSEFGQDNNLSSMEAEERKFSTKIDIKVLGYLMGAENNQENPVASIRENAVQLRIQRERVIFGDPINNTHPGHGKGIDKYIE